MTNFEEFPELTPEQFAGLSEADRTAYEELRQMSPAERVRFLGHVKIVAAVEKFVASVCDQHDLTSTWPGVDPNLRLCMAQQWILANARSFEAQGYGRDEVAAILADERPDHPLWQHFERVQVRSISGIMPDPMVRKVGAATRLLAPDVELLFVHDHTGRDGNYCLPGVQCPMLPMAMRWDGQSWLAASFGTESLPIPGWPPTF